MSRWNHSLCETCWDAKEPDRTPVRTVEAEEENCCICDAITKSGIYVRMDPNIPGLKCEKGSLHESP